MLHKTCTDWCSQHFTRIGARFMRHYPLLGDKWLWGKGISFFFSGIVTDKLPMLQCIINPSSMFIQTYLIKLSGSLGKAEDSRAVGAGCFHQERREDERGQWRWNVLNSLYTCVKISKIIFNRMCFVQKQKLINVIFVKQSWWVDDFVFSVGSNYGCLLSITIIVGLTEI